MVGRFIENQYVRSGNHHFGKQAAHLFTTGKDFYLFHAIFSCKQHTSEEAADIGCVLDRRVSGEPVCDRIVVVEFCGRILREVRLGGCNAPFVGSFVGFKLACKDLEQRGLCQLVAADKCDLVVVTNDKGDIV
mgnify:CR=1 FL=1